MKKVFTFSLWGKIPKYLVGAIKNVEIIKKEFPDFECWFYIHEDSVPNETINKLKEFDNVNIILKSGDLNVIKPMMWRFEAIDDPQVYIMLSRDTDTRILLREKLAVEEWINSNCIFHIIRDHPWHSSKIMGGMFGVKKEKDIIWKQLMENVSQNSDRDYDQEFLSNVIYPIYINQSMIHASFHKLEGELCKDLHLKHEDDDYKFIGEYVYEDESRNKINIEELKRGFL